MKRIYFYKTASGKEVITDFITNLDDNSKARIRNVLRLLEKYGLGLSKNQSIKKISRKPDIFELRIVGKTQYRLLFFVYNEKIYLILNIFVKKKQNTPLKEMQLAKRRIKEFV